MIVRGRHVNDTCTDRLLLVSLFDPDPAFLLQHLLEQLQ